MKKWKRKKLKREREREKEWMDKRKSMNVKWVRERNEKKTSEKERNEKQKEKKIKERLSVDKHFLFLWSV